MQNFLTGKHCGFSHVVHPCKNMRFSVITVPKRVLYSFSAPLLFNIFFEDNLHLTLVNWLESCLSNATFNPKIFIYFNIVPEGI